LETSASQGVKSLFELFNFVKLGVEFDDCNVLLTGTLLGLNESSCIIDASDKTASDLRIESTTVASLFNFQHLFDPGNDFVRTGI